MSPARPMRLVTSAAVLAVAVGLAGCVSLFPKDKPVQMYRFGVTDAPVADVATSGRAVARTPTAFTRPSATDRILTVAGQKTAYIADARWVSPAALMFDDAVERAFESRPGAPRYVTRGDLQSADIALRLEVDTFEARYLDGDKAAPTIVVTIRGTLVRPRDRAVLGEKVFSVSKPASDNRVGPIASAFDAAVKDSVTAVVDWTATTVAAAPPA